MPLSPRELARRRLIALLWRLPEDEVADLARLLAEDLIDQLDPTERRRIDGAIERALKKAIGPAAARFARGWLAEIRGGAPPQ